MERIGMRLSIVAHITGIKFGSCQVKKCPTSPPDVKSKIFEGEEAKKSKAAKRKAHDVHGLLESCASSCSCCSNSCSWKNICSKQTIECTPRPKHNDYILSCVLLIHLKRQNFDSQWSVISQLPAGSSLLSFIKSICLHRDSYSFEAGWDSKGYVLDQSFSDIQNKQGTRTQIKKKCFPDNLGCLWQDFS